MREGRGGPRKECLGATLALPGGAISGIHTKYSRPVGGLFCLSLSLSISIINTERTLRVYGAAATKYYYYADSFLQHETKGNAHI